MLKQLALFLIVAWMAVHATSCSKRLIIPGAIAGTGGVLMASGAIYRATIDEKGSADFFGETTAQRTTTSTLLFTGTALVLVGIIWSATQDVCESNVDCWKGDICNIKRKECIPKPLSPPSISPSAPAQPSLDSAYGEPLFSVQVTAPLPIVKPL